MATIAENLTPAVPSDAMEFVRSNAAGDDWGLTTYAQLKTQLLADGFTTSTLFDTFAELDLIVADKSLANLDDKQTFADEIDFGAPIRVNAQARFYDNTTLTGRLTYTITTTGLATANADSTTPYLNCTAACTVTMANTEGAFYIVKNSGASTNVTILPNVGTIEGAASYTIPPRGAVTIIGGTDAFIV